MRSINPNTLARVRGSIKAVYLTDECDIYEPLYVTDDYGDTNVTPTLAASGVKCRLNTVTLADSEAKSFDDRSIMEDVYNLLVPDGTVLDIEYQIQTGGQRYEVTVIRDGLTDAVYVEAEIRRIRT